MSDQIQNAAGIATIIGLLWTLFFGGRLVTEVLRSLRQRAQKVKPITVTNILLAFIAVVLIAPHAAWSTAFPFILFGVSSAKTVYYPYDRILALEDNFTNGSNIRGWEVGSDKDGVCSPITENYVIETQSGNFATCRAASTHFSDFTYQVQLTIFEGDKGGLLFRSDDTGNNFYYFVIGSDGTYALNIAKDNRFVKTVKSGSSSVIKISRNQLYRVAVIARKSTFELWVNETFVATAYDTTYTSGQIGVIADGPYALTEVGVTQAKVWTW